MFFTMKTVKDLRKLIKGLPSNMPIDFAPITMAWLGSSNSIYAREIEIYTHDDSEKSDIKDPTAKCTIYLHEEEG